MRLTANGRVWKINKTITSIKNWRHNIMCSTSEKIIIWKQQISWVLVFLLIWPSSPSCLQDLSSSVFSGLKYNVSRVDSSLVSPEVYNSKPIFKLSFWKFCKYALSRFRYVNLFFRRWQRRLNLPLSLYHVI